MSSNVPWHTRLIRVLIFGTGFAIFAPCCINVFALRSRNEELQRCARQMKRIVSLLYQYESLHGNAPPQFVAGSDGTRLHSWRVILMAYHRYALERPPQPDEYDFSMAWDSERNAPIASYIPFEFEGLRPLPSMTPYLALVRADGKWEPPAAPAQAETTTEWAEAISDRSESSRRDVAVIALPEHPVRWTELRDLEPGDMNAESYAKWLRELLLESRLGGAYIGFWDGGVYFMPASVSDEELLRLVSDGTLLVEHVEKRRK